MSKRDKLQDRLNLPSQIEEIRGLITSHEENTDLSLMIECNSNKVWLDDRHKDAVIKFLRKYVTQLEAEDKAFDNLVQKLA